MIKNIFFLVIMSQSIIGMDRTTSVTSLIDSEKSIIQKLDEEQQNYEGLIYAPIDKLLQITSEHTVSNKNKRKAEADMNDESSNVLSKDSDSDVEKFFSSDTDDKISDSRNVSSVDIIPKSIIQRRRGNPCKICHKPIVGNMTYHIRTHTQEKPFKCSGCRKTFSQLCNAKRHAHYIHADELSEISISWYEDNQLVTTRVRNSEFKCIPCKKSFYTSRDLERHLATRTHNKE